jgi:hypothetical protein
MDALRGAVNLGQIGFGQVGVPSLGVPAGVGGPGAAPVGNVTVSPMNSPSALFGNPAALAQMRSGLNALAASAGFGFGGNAPGVGGAAVAGGTPGPTDFGPARGAMGDVSTSAVTGAPAPSPAPSPAVAGSPATVAAASPTSPTAIGSPAAAPAAAPSPTTGLASAAQTATQTSQAAPSPNPAAPPTSPAGLSPGEISGILQALVGAMNANPTLTGLAQNSAMGLG